MSPLLVASVVARSSLRDVSRDLQVADERSLLKSPYFIEEQKLKYELSKYPRPSFCFLHSEDLLMPTMKRTNRHQTDSFAKGQPLQKDSLLQNAEPDRNRRPQVVRDTLGSYHLTQSKGLLLRNRTSFFMCSGTNSASWESVVAQGTQSDRPRFEIPKLKKQENSPPPFCKKQKHEKTGKHAAVFFFASRDLSAVRQRVFPPPQTNRKRSLPPPPPARHA